MSNSDSDEDTGLLSVVVAQPTSNNNTNTSTPPTPRNSNSKKVRTSTKGTINNDSDDEDDSDDEEEKSISFLRRIKLFLMCEHKPMTAEQKLTLSWVDKWRKYGRFPWKFFIHLLVTVFVTILVFMVHTDNAYVVANMSTFYTIFFPEGSQPDYGFDPDSGTAALYTIEDTVNLANYSVQNFYDFPPNSVDDFRFGSTNTTPPTPPLLIVTYYTAGGYNVFNPEAYEVDASLSTAQYNLSTTDLGPLSQLKDQELRDWFISLESFEIHFILYNTQLLNDQITDNLWKIVLMFDNSQHGGQIVLTLSAIREFVPRNIPFNGIISSPTIILNVITLILCATSSLISLKALGESFYLYQQTKKIIEFKKMKKKSSMGKVVGGTLSFGTPGPEKNKIIAWSQLPWSIKLKFFNFWFINNIIGNIFVIIANCFEVLSFLGPQTTIEYIVKFFLGFGCLLSWINMMRYFEFDRKYTILIKALGNGMPNVIRFIVGALPMFIGYALFGMLLFAQDTQRFADFDQAAITLFSLQNGDDLQNTFRTTEQHTVISRLYFYSFIMVFIYAVANIFIAIIEDSYFTVKGSTNGDIPRDQDEDSNLNHETELNNDAKLWNKILKIHRPNNPNKKKKTNVLSNSNSSNSTNQDPNNLTSMIGQLIRQEQEKFNKDLEIRLTNIINAKLNGNVPVTPRGNVPTTPRGTKR